MRALLLALMIQATFPITEDLKDAAELLRQAAIKAGCATPSLSMRWLGGDKGVEIEVRCLEVPNGR